MRPLRKSLSAAISLLRLQNGKNSSAYIAYKHRRFSHFSLRSIEISLRNILSQRSLMGTEQRILPNHYLARSERSHKASQLWDFRTTTRGKERSDATSLGVSEVTKRHSFGTSERLVPRSRSAEGRREARSEATPPR